MWPGLDARFQGSTCIKVPEVVEMQVEVLVCISEQYKTAEGEKHGYVQSLKNTQFVNLGSHREDLKGLTGLTCIFSGWFKLVGI